MELDSRHYEAIQILIENRFTKITQKDLAKRLEVSLSTLKRWRADPLFQDAYQKALEKWKQAFEDVWLWGVKERVLELVRLYLSVPDSYITKFLKATASAYDPDLGEVVEFDANIRDTDGKILRDPSGTPISVLAVRKLNTDAKLKILKQIAYEAGIYAQTHGGDAPDDFARSIREALDEMDARSAPDLTDADPPLDPAESPSDPGGPVS